MQQVRSLSLVKQTPRPKSEHRSLGHAALNTPAPSDLAGQAGSGLVSPRTGDRPGRPGAVGGKHTHTQSAGRRENHHKARYPGVRLGLRSPSCLGAGAAAVGTPGGNSRGGRKGLNAQGVRCALAFTSICTETQTAASTRLFGAKGTFLTIFVCSKNRRFMQRLEILMGIFQLFPGAENLDVHYRRISPAGKLINKSPDLCVRKRRREMDCVDELDGPGRLHVLVYAGGDGKATAFTRRRFQSSLCDCAP